MRLLNIDDGGVGSVIFLIDDVDITETIDDDGCEHFVQDVSISERWLDRL